VEEIYKILDALSLDVAEGGDGMHQNRQQSCSVAQAPHAVLTVMMMLLLQVYSCRVNRKLNAPSDCDCDCRWGLGGRLMLPRPGTKN
jgi:hypothetical protein